MMVVFLAGLVSMILMRTLRKDFVQIQKSEEDLEDVYAQINYCVEN